MTGVIVSVFALPYSKGMAQSQVFAPGATRTQKGFWEGDLGYAHAFVTVITALTLGLAFHVWVGYAWIQVFAPWELGLTALTPLGILSIAAHRRPGHRLIRWITGIPMAMISTGTLGLMALVGGTLTKEFFLRYLGLETPWASWPFLMVGYLMLANLLGSCGRRALPLNYTNVVYLMSHLGLSVALIGGAASSLTLERNLMVLFPGHPATVMSPKPDVEVPAPFPVILKEFRMESFAPTLALARLDPNAEDGMKFESGSLLAKKGNVEKISGLKVEVLEHLPHAAFDGSTWRAVAWKTAAPATRVRATLPDGQTKEGWVSCGSMETIPAYLQLDKEKAIFMNKTRPKKFESELTIKGKTQTVGVNKPLHVEGWEIYQFSYDEKMGAASHYSVIELVRDRGLPVAYTGIFMMLLGALLHLWNGIGGKR